MKRYVFAIAILIAVLQSKAQTPAPAPVQQKAVLIIHAVVHVGNGTVIENGVLAFDEGKLTYVGNDKNDVDTSDCEIIDAGGSHVYPGFILPVSQLGLDEVSAVSATQDRAEVGELNPNVRTSVSYNTDSELIPTLRFNGILTTQIVPQGGTISGTSSIVQLDAWNWEDAVILEEDGVHLRWPPKTTGPAWWLGETERKSNKKYAEQVQAIADIFDNAQNYSKDDMLNLKLNALKGVFTGEKQLFIHVNKANEIIASVEFAKSYGVKNTVLVSANDIQYILEYIKTNNISVILNSVLRLPSRADEDIDMPVRLPKMLSDYGIPFCLGYLGSTMSQRNLAFFAGATVQHGLSKEEALSTITLHTAKILKIEDQLGSLEVGKNATLFISKGDALDMRGNILTHAFIDGRLVTLDAMQQRLYDKYKAKYDQ